MLIHSMCFLSSGGNAREDTISPNISLYLPPANLIVSNSLANSSHVEAMYFPCIVSMNY